MSFEITPHFRVEHPQLTVQQLADLAQNNRVERSAHLGNLNARELTLLTNLPLDILLVDTINGDDRYADPARVHIGDDKLRVTPARQARNVVVTALPAPIDAQQQLLNDHPALKEIAPSNSMAELHRRSIDALNTDAHIMTITEAVTASGELGQVLMAQLAERGLVRRVVAADGHIRQLNEPANIQETGIFGQNDTTPAEEGMMLPLQGMLAFDALQALEQGNDTVYHLGGNDMRQYTRDPALMMPVADTIASTLAELGKPQSAACYQVIDVTGVAQVVDPASAHINSQYDLITEQPDQANRHVHIDEAKYDAPAYTDMP